LTNGVEEYIFEKNQILKAYPNPTNNVLYVTLDLPKKSNGTLSIIDLLGNVIHEEKITNKIADSYVIDMSKYSAGVYQVLLNTDAGVSSQKVILEK